MFWFLQVSLMAGAWVGHNHIFGIIAFFVFILNYFHNFHNIPFFMCLFDFFHQFVNIFVVLRLQHRLWRLGIIRAWRFVFSAFTLWTITTFTTTTLCSITASFEINLLLFAKSKQFILCHSCLCNLVSVKLSHWILYSNSSVFRNPKISDIFYKHYY